MTALRIRLPLIEGFVYLVFSLLRVPFASMTSVLSLHASCSPIKTERLPSRGRSDLCLAHREHGPSIFFNDFRTSRSRDLDSQTPSCRHTHSRRRPCRVGE